MLLTLNLLSLIMLLFTAIHIGKIQTYSPSAENAWYCFSASMILFLILSVASLCKWYDIAGEKTIDEKIALYQEENAKIEDKIDVLVKEYMNYEQEVFVDIKSDSSIELVSLFPELKADEFVAYQISLYKTNAEEIRNLKEEKTELSNKRWLLYFGH